MSASLSEEIREGEADAPMPKKGKKKPCKGCSKAKPCHKCSKDDALTVQEYLDACDLGIQGRSRTYIRARLDTAQERADQKCGKSAIAKGKKCRKGMGGAAKTAAKVALVAGAGAFLAHGMRTANKQTQAAAAAKPNAARDFMNAHAEKVKSAAAAKDKVKSAFAQRNARREQSRNSQEKDMMAKRAKAWGDRAEKAEQVKKMVSKYKRRRDEMDSPRTDKKCGASAIPDNKKCNKAVVARPAKPGLKSKVRKAAHGAVALASAVASRRASKKRAASGDQFSEIFGSY
jgi:hypothetical protein